MILVEWKSRRHLTWHPVRVRSHQHLGIRANGTARILRLELIDDTVTSATAPGLDHLDLRHQIAAKVKDFSQQSAVCELIIRMRWENLNSGSTGASDQMNTGAFYSNWTSPRQP